MEPAARSARFGFRDAIDVDDATWARGRGWALSIALIQLPYYEHTNPDLAVVARRTVAEVLADRSDRRRSDYGITTVRATSGREPSARSSALRTGFFTGSR